MFKYLKNFDKWIKVNETIDSEHWEICGKKLIGKYNFDSEEQLDKFLSDVKQIAKKAKHDPVIKKLSTTSVQLDVWTHSVDAITVKDFDLADKISKLKK